MRNFREVSIAVFVNNENQILLQKRGNYSKNGEDYAFLGGGKKHNETPKETLFREIQEELGLDMKSFQYDFLGTFTEHYDENDFYAIRSIYLIKTNKNATSFTVYEGERVEYFTLSEARKLSFPNNPNKILDIIEAYLNEKK